MSLAVGIAGRFATNPETTMVGRGNFPKSVKKSMFCFLSELDSWFLLLHMVLTY